MRFSNAYSDDAFLLSDHVGSKSDAMSDVGFECVEQIVSNGKIGFHSFLRWLSQKHGIFDNRSYHLSPPLFVLIFACTNKFSCKHL